MSDGASFCIVGCSARAAVSHICCTHQRRTWSCRERCELRTFWDSMATVWNWLAPMRIRWLRFGARRPVMFLRFWICFAIPRAHCALFAAGRWCSVILRARRFQALSGMTAMVTGLRWISSAV